MDTVPVIHAKLIPAVYCVPRHQVDKEVADPRSDSLYRKKVCESGF